MPSELTAAIVEATRKAFDQVRAAHPDESFYCYALYTTDAAIYISPTCSGEQGLRRAARRYVERSGGTLEDHAEALRWNPCDWPYHLVGDEHFSEVEALLERRPHPYDLDDDDEAMQEVRARFQSCREALAILDGQGYFGTGEARNEVLLNVLQGDQSSRRMLAYAARLNPPAARAAFEAEFREEPPTGSFRTFGSLKTRDIDDLAVSADGAVLAACGSGGELFAWDLAGARELLARRSDASHWDLALSHDGRFLVVGDDRSVVAVTLPSGDRSSPIVEHEQSVCGLALAPDGDTVVSSAWDSSLRATDIASGRIRWEVGLLAKSICFSPDGTKIAAGGNQVWLLDATTGEVERRLEVSTDGRVFYSVAWSRQGMLALGSTDPSPVLSIVDPCAAGERRELKTVEDGELPQPDGVNALAFSPDGRMLATAHSVVGENARVHFWDVDAGLHLGWVRGRHERMNALVFLADHWLAAGGTDIDTGPPVYVWDVEGSLPRPGAAFAAPTRPR